MVSIKVSDSGECRVTVRGPWDTVKKNLEVAAKKVREMARDSRQFANITDGTYLPTMKPKNQYPEETPKELYPAQQQEFRPARQQQINRPPQPDRSAGGAA